MCLHKQRTCACGATLMSSTQACHGADTCETPLSKLALGGSPKLAHWNPSQTIRVHPVHIVRTYETTCICNHSASALTAPQNTPSDLEAYPEPYRQPTPEDEYAQADSSAQPVHGVTKSVASFMIFAACGCSVDHMSFEGVRPFEITMPDQIECREERDYLQTGPWCGQCLEARDRVAGGNANFQADLVDALEGMGGLDLSAEMTRSERRVEDAADAFEAMAI